MAPSSLYFLRGLPFTCNIINTQLIKLTMSCAIQKSVLQLPKNRKNKKIAFQGGPQAMIDAGLSKDEKAEQQGTGELGKHVKVRWRAEGSMRGVSKLLSLGNIYNILDMCINEETIRNPQNGQSLLKTLFHMRVITKLETTKDFVRMWLRPTASPSSVPYIIERFNSFGDSFFHSVANFLQSICTYFPPTKTTQSTSSSALTSELSPQPSAEVMRLLEELQGQPCFMKILPDEYIFTNALIQMLGEQPEDFARECVRYRMMMEDFFSAENYRALLQFNISFISAYLRYLQGAITLQEMIAGTEVRFTSSLKTKQEKELKVVVRGFMPRLNIFCMVVEEVLSSNPLLPSKAKPVIQQKLQLEKLILDEKQEMLDKMNPINAVLAKNAVRCGYVPKPRRRRRKSECDYDY